MRILITLLLPALLAAPAFAKSKAKPAAKMKAKTEAPRIKSDFTGKLLSYNELIRLPKAKRMTYMRRMVDLLSTMESFNNRYTVAERDQLREFREYVAYMMQMVSFLPEANADEFDDTPPPVDVSKIIPAWNGFEWTCGRGAAFDYVMRACMVLNSSGQTTFTHKPDVQTAEDGEACPGGTHEVPHYRPWIVACIPDANWALIPAERKSGIEKKGFLPPSYLRNQSYEDQKRAILGGAPYPDMAPVPPAPEEGPSHAAGEPTGDVGTGTSQPPGQVGTGTSQPPGQVGTGTSEPGNVGVGTSEPAAAPATCEPATVACKALSAADRQTAISRFRSTAQYQGVSANVCIAGGFASKYTTTHKSPSTCDLPKTLPGVPAKPCKNGEVLCNPALFCLGGKNKAGKFEPVMFCVKKKGDRKNLPITDSCAAKYAQMIAGTAPLIDGKPASKGKAEACDPKYLPENAKFKKIWEDLVAGTQKLRDVWCGNQDFAALFCRECEIVNDKIYAMNKEATGTGCPEVRAPAHEAVPPVQQGQPEGIRETGTDAERPDGR
jgi:hypothetical protein